MDFIIFSFGQNIQFLGTQSGRQLITVECDRGIRCKTQIKLADILDIGIK